MALLALPFAGIVGLASISLAQAPGAHWQAMLMGDQWLECLLSIPVIAIVPFALVVWAVRQAAPTNLRRAAALAGLAAGGLSAVGYALHCTADSLPFVAVWYSGTMALHSRRRRPRPAVVKMVARGAVDTDGQPGAVCFGEF